MAAGGFREFVAGEVLDEDKINDFLMQGVLVFADAAARDAAVTAPVEGQFAFLKDDDALTFYDGSAWVPFETGLQPIEVLATTGSPSITSGTVIDGVTYDIYDFTGDGSITIDAEGVADLLLIGGGGAGGSQVGSGGGAGGLLFIEDAYLSAGTATVDVGAGGIGRVLDTGGGIGTNGEGGRASILSDYFAVGGGGGAGLSFRNNALNVFFGNVGGNGGSGGGAGGFGNAAKNFIGFGTPGQGNNGGTEASLGAGGGGGAGAVGGNATTNTGGNGGAGSSNSITGSAVTYAGGGGGSGGVTGGSGGSGGGGAGSGGATGIAGTDNLGGGGGGSFDTTAGANGGTGRIIVRVRV